MLHAHLSSGDATIGQLVADEDVSPHSTKLQRKTKLIHWSRFLLEKLLVAQILKKTSLMSPEGEHYAAS
jgi:hypothetical protein